MTATIIVSWSPTSQVKWRSFFSSTVVILRSTCSKRRSTCSRRRTISEGNRVMVARFENRTIDSSLDPRGRLAADRIIQLLAQVSNVDVVPRVLDPTGADGGPPDAAAMVVAALDHPHICGIYDVGSVEGVRSVLLNQINRKRT